MIPEMTHQVQEPENYNETIMIPLLEKRVHSLTSAAILAEAKLEIALKEKAELQKQLDAARAAAQSVPAPINPVHTEDGA